VAHLTSEIYATPTQLNVGCILRVLYILSHQ
jgi:hypothetical protein